MYINYWLYLLLTAFRCLFISTVLVCHSFAIFFFSQVHFFAITQMSVIVFFFFLTSSNKLLITDLSPCAFRWFAVAAIIVVVVFIFISRIIAITVVRKNIYKLIEIPLLNNVVDMDYNIKYISISLTMLFAAFLHSHPSCVTKFVLFPCLFITAAKNGRQRQNKTHKSFDADWIYCFGD